jgi:hypothetical protein
LLLTAGQFWKKTKNPVCLRPYSTRLFLSTYPNVDLLQIGKKRKKKFFEEIFSFSEVFGSYLPGKPERKLLVIKVFSSVEISESSLLLPASHAI